MKLKAFSIIALTSTAIVVSSEIANAFNLNLLGVLDNGAGDLNPNRGIIRLENFQLGSSEIFFSGEANESPRPAYNGHRPSSQHYTIKVTNASFKNNAISDRSVPTQLLVQGNYILSLPLSSTAQLLASLSGINEGLRETTGNELFSASATATSFPSNLVTVNYDPPFGLTLPRTFSDLNLSSGSLSSTMGTLTANITLSLAASESFILPDSADFCIARNCFAALGIPEPPSSLGLLVVTVLGLGAAFKRKQK